MSKKTFTEIRRKATADGILVTTIVYSEHGDGMPEEHQLRSMDPPRPELDHALTAFLPCLCAAAGVASDKPMHIEAVILQHDKHGERQVKLHGIKILGEGLKELELKVGALGVGDYSLSGEVAELEAEAGLYLVRERAQGDLFKGVDATSVDGTQKVTQTTLP